MISNGNYAYDLKFISSFFSIGQVLTEITISVGNSLATIFLDSSWIDSMRNFNENKFCRNCYVILSSKQAVNSQNVKGLLYNYFHHNWFILSGCIECRREYKLMIAKDIHAQIDLT